jgi:hypothetical protein
MAGRRKKTGDQESHCLIKSEHPEDFVACQHQRCKQWDQCQKRQPSPYSWKPVHVHITEQSLEELVFANGYFDNHQYRWRPTEKYCFRITVPKIVLDREGAEHWLDFTVLIEEEDFLKALCSIRYKKV